MNIINIFNTVCVCSRVCLFVRSCVYQSLEGGGKEYYRMSSPSMESLVTPCWLTFDVDLVTSSDPCFLLFMQFGRILGHKSAWFCSPGFKRLFRFVCNTQVTVRQVPLLFFFWLLCLI